MIGSSAHVARSNGRLPAIPGYDLEENYPVYIPDNLWDYINGAADAYLSYLFVDLNIGEYINGEGETIKVEVYKHKSNEYAYGIYCSERFPDYNFIEIGAQGYSEPGMVQFLQGSYYVKVISGSEDPVEKELILIAEKISKWLGGDPQLPPLISAFPSAGKVDKSECFISNNFLGHEFLSDAYVASYEVKDREFKIFIMQKETPSESVNIIQDYMRFAKMEIKDIVNGQYDIEDRYNGDVNLIFDGNLIFGFLDCGDQGIVSEYSQLIKRKI
jgi:hypothetical protein